MVIFPVAAYGHHFTEGLACRGGLDGDYGCIDKTGRSVIPPIFDDLSLFSEGLNDGKIHGKCVYIDRTGKIVLTPNFRNNAKGDCSIVSGTFSEGLARWRVGSKFGYINKKGRLVIPARYQFTDHFSEGLAWVENNGRIGFIDKRGRMVIKMRRLHHVDDFSGGLAYVVTQNGEHGYIDRTGKYVWRPQKQSKP
ncbi:MAG: WG repeat-containing protein [Acidobacteriota bacterium]